MKCFRLTRLAAVTLLVFFAIPNVLLADSADQASSGSEPHKPATESDTPPGEVDAPDDAPVPDEAGERLQLSEDLKQLAMDFVEAYYRGDSASLEALSIPGRKVELLTKGREPLSKEDQQWVEQLLDDIRIENAEPPGHARVPGADRRRQLMAVSSNGMLPVDLQLHHDEWKVDARWLISLHAEDDAATQVARDFIRYSVAGNPGKIAQLALPHPDLYALSLETGHSKAQINMLNEMIAQMPIIRLEPGDIYHWPGKPARVVDQAAITDDRCLLLAFFNRTKLPLELTKTDDGWRVDAAAWIAAVKSNKRDEHIEKLQSAKASYDTRLAVSRVKNAVAEQDNETLNDLLNRDLPQVALDAGLAEAVIGYWIANQHGSLEPKSFWILTAERFLKKGADPQVKVHGQYTPLMVAVHFGNGSNMELVTLLLRQGADVNAVNKSGSSALDLAQNENYRKPLLDAGAKPGAEILKSTLDENEE